METVVVIRRFFRSYHRPLDSSGIATPCVSLLRQASAIACRDHRVASLRRRRELEVRAMVPLLRQCSGFGEINRIFDRDLVAQTTALRGEGQPLDRVLARTR